jgi:hypothetical protein
MANRTNIFFRGGLLGAVRAVRPLGPDKDSSFRDGGLGSAGRQVGRTPMDNGKLQMADETGTPSFCRQAVSQEHGGMGKFCGVSRQKGVRKPSGGGDHRTIDHGP